MGQIDRDVIANTPPPAIHLSNCAESITAYLTPKSTAMSARTDVEASQNQASSGITPDSLKTTLQQKLEATHVDIEDLSGILVKNMLHLTPGWELIDYRWLRSDVRSNHCLTPIRQEDDSSPTPSRQCHSQTGDRYYSRLDTEMLHPGRVGEEEGERMNVGNAIV